MTLKPFIDLIRTAWSTLRNVNLKDASRDAVADIKDIFAEEMDATFEKKIKGIFKKILDLTEGCAEGDSLAYMKG